MDGGGQYPRSGTFNKQTEFVGNVPDSFKCVLCKKLLTVPMQARCGHRYCKACFDSYVRPGERKVCPKCEAEGETGEDTLLKRGEANPDNPVRREISCLQTVCAYKDEGCQWSDQLKLYQGHVNACEYRHSRRQVANNCLLQPNPNPIPAQPQPSGLNPRPAQPQSAQCADLQAEQERRNIEAFDQQMGLLNNNPGLVVFPAISNDIEQCRAAVNEMQAAMELQKQQMDDNQQKLQTLQLRVDHQNDAIINMSLRMEKFETVSYDGKLIWKISDYSETLQRAKDGKAAHLYSPPFYTSRYGYKMCAKVFLNGDGIGKGTHMSLYFIIMRGKYDELQKWPFQQSVSFKIANQNTSGDDVCVRFLPNPQHLEFQRPVEERNVGVGYPRFIRQQLVQEGSGFLRDDTLFIQVCVDTKTLVETIRNI